MNSAKKNMQMEKVEIFCAKCQEPVDAYTKKGYWECKACKAITDISTGKLAEEEINTKEFLSINKEGGKRLLPH